VAGCSPPILPGDDVDVGAEIVGVARRARDRAQLQLWTDLPGRPGAWQADDVLSERDVLDTMNSTRFRACVVAGLAAAAIVARSGTAIADGVWEKAGEFVVLTAFKHDFKMRRAGKVYFQTIGRQDGAMKDVVGTRLSLASREDAEYLLQIQSEKKTNYAVRNDERIPSDAYVIFSICDINWSNMRKDCQNSQFFSFDYRGGLAFFNKAFDLWLQRVQGP
jgi:hypothetical protein